MNEVNMVIVIGGIFLFVGLIIIVACIFMSTNTNMNRVVRFMSANTNMNGAARNTHSTNRILIFFGISAIIVSILCASLAENIVETLYSKGLIGPYHSKRNDMLSGLDESFGQLRQYAHSVRNIKYISLGGGSIGLALLIAGLLSGKFQKSVQSLIRCRECGTENAVENRFCKQCGTIL
ncbi:MAG: zinc-ribbon domain-containing protein [Candidatus Poribacteria bacterium]